MHLLLTRPIDQSVKSARRLDERGHTSLIDPLLTIEDLNIAFPEAEADALVLTSSNAATRLNRVWPEELGKDIPVLATGRATQNAARDTGFLYVHSVDGNALDLVSATSDWLKANGLNQNANLIYPRADAVAHDICALLKKQDVSCINWPIYKSVPSTALSRPALDALESGAISGVLLYSPRTAQIFADLAKDIDFDAEIFTLSENICLSLPQSIQGRCHIAKRPNESALFDLLERN